MFRFAICRLALMFAFAGTGAMAGATAPGCEAIKPLFPDSSCVANGHGVAIAPSAADAAILLAAAEPGRMEFERAFAVAAAHYAIILAGKDGVAATTEAAVQNAGFGAALVWLSQEAKIAQAEASVRKIVEEKLTAAGLGEKEREAAVASAVAQARQQMASTNSAIDTVAVPHELGHKWFIKAFWPDAPQGVDGQYGGPGPDWMDELAAVILEPAASKESRRADFWRRYRVATAKAAEPGNRPDTLLDIEGFLASRHPMTAVTGGIGKAHSAAGTSGFRVIAGPEAAAIAGDGIAFYLKSLLISDYLVKQSDNPAIFGTITRALAKGMSFDDWLSAQGAAHGLPSSQKAFGAAYLRWLAENVPQDLATL